MVRPYSLSFTEPTMIIPLPSTNSAWAMVLSFPGTTKCFSKPKARHSHSMAAGASRYIRHGMMEAVPVFCAGVVIVFSAP